MTPDELINEAENLCLALNHTSATARVTREMAEKLLTEIKAYHYAREEHNVGNSEVG